MVSTEIIKQCKVFKMVPDDLIQEIASIGILKEYKADVILFNTDEQAEYMMVLVEGRVDIMTTKRTQLITIQNVYPGDAFALSAMITGYFYGAAKALEDSVACALPADKLFKILEKDYKAAFLFMKQIALLVSSRLVRMHHQLDVTGPGYI